jgi:hypothetical protein
MRRIVAENLRRHRLEVTAVENPAGHLADDFVGIVGAAQDAVANGLESRAARVGRFRRLRPSGIGNLDSVYATARLAARVGLGRHGQALVARRVRPNRAVVATIDFHERSSVLEDVGI